MQSLFPKLKNKICLEIGCAGAIYSRIMQKAGAIKVTSFDYSDEMIEIARNQTIGITYESRNINERWKTNSEFDFICASFVIHYSKELKTTLNNIRNSLKSNGCFIFSIPNPQLFYDSLVKIKTVSAVINNEIVHFKNYPIGHIVEELGKGFTIEKCVINCELLVIKCVKNL